MKIRRAIPCDFEVYKTLFTNKQSDMLYRAQKSDIKPQKDAKDWFGFDEETLKRFKEELRRTPEKFQKTLKNFGERRIYIIEDEDVIVGFFEMFRIGMNKWKLAFCSMKKGYINQESFTQAVQLLLEQKSVKTIEVCVFYKSCVKRMENAGFLSIGGGFYRIEAKE